MIPMNKILIGLDSKGDLTTIETDELEEGMYIRPAPGKCCPDASCDYGYYKKLLLPKHCRECGTLCKDCTYHKEE